MKLKTTMFAAVLALSAVCTAQARSSLSVSVEADRLTLKSARHQLEVDERLLHDDRRMHRSAAVAGDTRKIATDRGRLEQAQTFLDRDLSAQYMPGEQDAARRKRHASVTAAR